MARSHSPSRTRLNAIKVCLARNIFLTIRRNPRSSFIFFLQIIFIAKLGLDKSLRTFHRIIRLKEVVSAPFSRYELS
jgi:hypothetical protein